MNLKLKIGLYAMDVALYFGPFCFSIVHAHNVPPSLIQGPPIQNKSHVKV